MKNFLRQIMLLVGLVCLSVLVGLVLTAAHIIEREAFFVVVTCNAFVGVVGMLLDKWFAALSNTGL